MNTPRPPSFQPSEGESIWTAMARELVQRPDGVAALHVQSAINNAIRPSQAAVARLVNALADQSASPADDAHVVEVAAATANWETICQRSMSDDMLAIFKLDAVKLLERRQTQPPEFGQILEGVFEEITDYGYQLGGDLDGVRGTWHRLWASISGERLFGTPEFQELISSLRSDFEKKLGRKMAASEWDKLVKHANHHCETVMKPLMGDGFGSDAGT